MFLLHIIFVTFPVLVIGDCNLSDWGDWGACTATCGGGLRERSRQSYSENCDTPLTESSPCNTLRCSCVDTPGWRSSTNNNCYQYVQYHLCTIAGGYGTGWKASMGTFLNYSTNGIDATQACCACGKEIVLCKGIECQHGGACHSGECWCTDGFEGTLCEIDVCEVKKEETLALYAASWSSPNVPSCGIAQAVDMLAQYNCTQEPGCQLITCLGTVPDAVFVQLAQTQC